MKGLSRRRSLVALTATCLAPAILPRPGRAQTTLPDRPLRILVGFAAGGGSELMARAIAPGLERRIGRRVSVENKLSGEDVTAGEFFRQDLEEGLVVAFMPSATLPMKPAPSPFPFDSQSTLVPLTTAGAFQVALAVSPMTPLATFSEYVAWVKANAAGHAQIGVTATDAYLKIYAMMIGRDIGAPLRAAPCPGARGLVDALVAHRVPAGLGSVTTLLQHDRHAEVRLLLTSGRQRVRVLRDVPTAVELGYPDLELQEWYGFFASSSMPGPVIAEWNRQLRAVLGESEVVAELAELGLDVETSTLAESAARFAHRFEAWKQRREAFGLARGG